MPSPSPDDLIAADAPPAFPPWMVAADPRLAAQETNRIYRAFRRRRTMHPRTTAQRATSWLGRVNMQTISQLVYVLWLLSFIGSNVGIPTHYLPSWLTTALIVLVVLTQLAAFLPRRWRKAPAQSDVSTLPRRLCGGFDRTRQTFEDEVLAFLGEVGATGLEVCEAAYLEARERDRGGSLAWGSWGVLGVLMVWMMAGSPTQIASWAIVPPAVALAVFLVALSIAGARYNRPTHDGMLGTWQRNMPRYRWMFGELAFWVDERATGCVIITLAIVGGTVALLFPVVVLAMMARDGHYWVVSVIVTILLIVATASVFPLGRHLAKKQEQKLDRQVADADLLFAFCLGETFRDDPDEVRALLIRQGKLGLDDPWPPRDAAVSSSSA